MAARTQGRGIEKVEIDYAIEYAIRMPVSDTQRVG